MKITPTVRQLRMLASVRGQTWLIREDKLQEFALAALELQEPQHGLEIDVEDFYELREPLQLTADGVAIIQIKGALMSQSPAIYEKLGMVTRYSTLMREVSMARDMGATAVLFNINSPGGTVSGNIEAARAIADIDMPTMGYCSGMACSAAYKLAAGMDQIVASPSADVGNIGTILSWADCSEFWKEMGIEFKALVSDGADLKSTFHTEPDEKQVEFLQEGVNEAGATFREWVAEHRDVSEEVWRAGWYSGDRAEALGLTDGQASFEEALANLTLASRAGRSVQESDS